MLILFEFCEGSSMLEITFLLYWTDVNEKKALSKFKILAVKDDHSLGMSLNIFRAGMVSMNVIQSVHCSQYVNFLWGFVINNRASM